MNNPSLEMRFDPQTINHLGLRMYSTLPPALAEIISNSYDADAENVNMMLVEEGGNPKEIIVKDDGIGLSLDEIRSNFLVIGKNRRQDGDEPTLKFKRLATGKKGLGKLALFGLAKTITVSTIQDNKHNVFMLDWDDLMHAGNTYHPKSILTDKQTNSSSNGTTITLTRLKRKTPFDFQGLADSLSKIFIFDKDFNVVIESPQGDKLSLDNTRKYNTLNEEFKWFLDSPLYIPESCEYYGKIHGELLTSKKPIKPVSGMRGITLFSRGKLVNSPEFFSMSDSSHFYQYLTGWISADFIDLLDEDVISTNRQSINWEHPEMEKLRVFLSGIVSQVNIDWRKKRKEKKKKELKESTGIDSELWIDTMPEDVGKKTSLIIEALGGEDALDRFTPIVKALHEIIPEYPLLHWRHLHKDIQESSRIYYQEGNYYNAFLEATKKYVSETRLRSKIHDKKERELMGAVFDKNKSVFLNLIANYKKQNGNDFTDDTKNNIQEGQRFLSQGVIVGGRHPVSHEEIVELKISGLFSEQDCLDMLSILSHLSHRLDNAEMKKI